MPVHVLTRPSLELTAVTAGYHPGVPVLDSLSLSLDGAGLVWVRGANGVGKSTLLEVCSGYLRPESGEVRIGGLPADSPAARAGRRVCRSGVALLPEMTVHDHLVLTARSSGGSLERLRDRARRYGLEAWQDSSAGSLSNGNRRKLWLLMCTPEPFAHLLLDEPFQGLDDHGCELLLSEIEDWRQYAMVVLVSHDRPAGLDADEVLDLGGRP